MFTGTGHRGVHASYLQYPFAALMEYFYATPLGSDRRVSTTVIRVTPSTIERHVVDFGEDTANAPNFLTPFDDGFYAMCPGVVLCKWMGNSFQPATVEEKQRLGGIDHLIRGDINNQFVNGWFVRQTRDVPGDQFYVEVGTKFAIAAKNEAGSEREPVRISVDLVRSGRPPEHLYSADASRRKMSKAEYELLFPKH